jgi:hypothetical protein
MCSVSIPKFRGAAAARFLFTLVCLNICLTPQVSVAQSDSALSSRSISFDIPAQPLDQALNAFSTTSGLQIFYENSLTTGHRSTAVKGEFERLMALEILMSGSGLTARVIADDTVSVGKPVSADPDTDGRPNRRSELAYLPYYGVLQAGAMKALCGSTETAPGTYHIVLQYWIDRTGKIAYSKLISSSGNDERDAAIVKSVQDLALPPPGNLPQPVTMAIEPAKTGGCASGNMQALRRP